MIIHKKAAECGDTQAAVKTSHIQDHSTRKSPTSTFIFIDAQYAIGADSHSWHVLQRRRYKASYRWELTLWFGILEQCVHGLWQCSVQRCGTQSLGEKLAAEGQRVISAICQALRLSFKVEVGS
jgi:hypothetical protein